MGGLWATKDCGHLQESTWTVRGFPPHNAIVVKQTLVNLAKFSDSEEAKHNKTRHLRNEVTKQHGSGKC
jgi:hypothetical protein